MRVIVGCLAVCALLILMSLRVNATEYRMIDLGEGCVWGINNNGSVVGWMMTQTGERVFCWQNGVKTLFAVPDGFTSSRAQAISDHGQVVGYAKSSSVAGRAFLWGSDGSTIDLGTLGGSTSWAYDINNFGQIVGYSTTADGYGRATLWYSGNIIDLGTVGGDQSKAFGINDNGWICGTSTDSAGV